MPDRELYLVRHAIASPRGRRWPDDTQRPLTRVGRDRFVRGVRGLRALGVQVDVVYTSPLVRARQTADLLAEGLAGTPPVHELPALAPGRTPAPLLRILARAGQPRRIALVGHEPELGAVLAWLLGCERPIPLKKGGMSRVDLAGSRVKGGGQLVWFLPPRMVRAVGEE
jgi:phosphohistidine phosphatase